MYEADESLGQSHGKSIRSPWPLPIWYWLIPLAFGLTFIAVRDIVPVEVGAFIKLGLTFSLAGITLRVLHDSARFMLVGAMLMAGLGDALGHLGL